MRKAILLTSLIIVMLCSTKVYALDWANIFVVWKGKVYVVKADYSRQAPFHLMNIISNIYFILCVVLLTFVLVLLRKMKEEKKKK